MLQETNSDFEMDIDDNGPPSLKRSRSNFFGSEQESKRVKLQPTAQARIDKAVRKAEKKEKRAGKRRGAEAEAERSGEMEELGVEEPVTVAGEAAEEIPEFESEEDEEAKKLMGEARVRREQADEAALALELSIERQNAANKQVRESRTRFPMLTPT